MLGFDEYQLVARGTAAYPIDMQLVYPVLGLCGEAGEVAEKVKKLYRDADGILDEDRRHAIGLELGDCLWYLAAAANDAGFTLAEIAELNMAKLAARRDRGTLHGDGDDR